MAGIVDAVRRVNEIMAEIAAGSAEQSAGIGQLNQAIAQIDATTQQNAALVEQAAAAARSLSEQAAGLKSAAAAFVFSYQNYVITYATADRRPIYAGLFNTIGAVFALLAPFIAGTIVSGFGYEVLFVVALTMAVLALFVAVRYVENPNREVSSELVAD